MTTGADFADAVLELAATLADASVFPADKLRQLGRLADTSGTGLGASLCRRAALVELARAAGAYQAASYDEGVAVRDRVCGLLGAEELRAADAGQTETQAAFRALRLGVARDLTERVADLAHLRTVTLPRPSPALAVAYRLYGDATRADTLANEAEAGNPLFLPVEFRARDQ